MRYQAALTVIGARSLLLYFVARGFSRIGGIAFNRFRIVEVPVAGLADMPRGYSCRSLSPGELASRVIDVGPEVQAKRFAGGYECLGVFDRPGELIAVAWLAREHPEDDSLDVRFLLPGDAAWDTGMWIRDDRRMGRAFAALWGAIRQWLETEGLNRTISTIVDYDIQSIASHSRLGARSLGYLTVVRIGRLQYAQSARPRWRRLGKGSKPTISLTLP